MTCIIVAYSCLPSWTCSDRPNFFASVRAAPETIWLTMKPVWSKLHVPSYRMPYLA